MLLHERRLDDAVDPCTLGVGERIDVRTLMGNPVVTGEVTGVNPFGVILREGGFFSRDMYLFVPIEEEPPVHVSKALYDSPDDRVENKLRGIGSPVVFEMKKIGDGDGSEGGDEKGGGVDKDASVDMDSLPQSIKRAIVSAKKMDTEQLNSVLSDIGDTAVKALKRVGVKEVEVYGLVSDIQKAVSGVLTKGKSK